MLPRCVIISVAVGSVGIQLTNCYTLALAFLAANAHNAFNATQTARKMHTLTVAQAQHALLLHANNNTLTVAQLQHLLQNVSVTFAQLLYVTTVQLDRKSVV